MRWRPLIDGGADQGLLGRQRRRAGTGSTSSTRRSTAHACRTSSTPSSTTRSSRRSATTARRATSRSSRPAPRSAPSTRWPTLCRHPDVFRAAICMSGTYDLSKLCGRSLEPRLLLLLAAALPARTSARARSSTRCASASCSSRRAPAAGRTPRSPGASPTCWARGIPNRVDDWGTRYDHDWPTWREMLPKYLSELA